MFGKVRREHRQLQFARFLELSQMPLVLGFEEPAIHFRFVGLLLLLEGQGIEPADFVQLPLEVRVGLGHLPGEVGRHRESQDHDTGREHEGKEPGDHTEIVEELVFAFMVTFGDPCVYSSSIRCSPRGSIVTSPASSASPRSRTR